MFCSLLLIKTFLIRVWKPLPRSLSSYKDMFCFETVCEEPSVQSLSVHLHLLKPLHNECFGYPYRYDWLANKSLRLGYFLPAMLAYGSGICLKSVL